MSIEQVTEKRKPGRPRKGESRAERHVTAADEAPEVARPTRKRNKLRDNYVGPLHIANPPEGWELRWVEDRADNGATIAKRLANDWTFVTTSEFDLQISQSYVYETSNVGSIYRTPAGKSSPNHLYLMKIPAEWYQEDQDAKEARIAKSESGLFSVDKNDGEYGASRAADGD